eukprot:COSAG02_NODE_59287_length_274_cov_1.765714_1_plen_46_part_01
MFFISLALREGGKNQAGTRLVIEQIQVGMARDGGRPRRCEARWCLV